MDALVRIEDIESLYEKCGLNPKDMFPINSVLHSYIENNKLVPPKVFDGYYTSPLGENKISNYSV